MQNKTTRKRYQQNVSTDNYKGDIEKAKGIWNAVWQREIQMTVTMRWHTHQIDWQNVKYPLPNVVKYEKLRIFIPWQKSMCFYTYFGRPIENI